MENKPIEVLITELETGAIELDNAISNLRKSDVFTNEDIINKQTKLDEQNKAKNELINIANALTNIMIPPYKNAIDNMTPSMLDDYIEAKEEYIKLKEELNQKYNNDNQTKYYKLKKDILNLMEDGILDVAHCFEQVDLITTEPQKDNLNRWDILLLEENYQLLAEANNLFSSRLSEEQQMFLIEFYEYYKSIDSNIKEQQRLNEQNNINYDLKELKINAIKNSKLDILKKYNNHDHQKDNAQLTDALRITEYKKFIQNLIEFDEKLVTPAITITLDEMLAKGVYYPSLIIKDMTENYNSNQIFKEVEQNIEKSSKELNDLDIIKKDFENMKNNPDQAKEYMYKIFSKPSEKEEPTIVPISTEEDNYEPRINAYHESKEYLGSIKIEEEQQQKKNELSNKLTNVEIKLEEEKQQVEQLSVGFINKVFHKSKKDKLEMEIAKDETEKSKLTSGLLTCEYLIKYQQDLRKIREQAIIEKPITYDKLEENFEMIEASKTL